MSTGLLLAGAIVLEVAAALSLSAALTHPGWYVLVAVGYVGAFALLPLVLRGGMSLGVAYGIWGASGVALTSLASAVLFGEKMTVISVAGLVLVIAGVVVVEYAAHHEQHLPEAAE